MNFSPITHNVQLVVLFATAFSFLADQLWTYDAKCGIHMDQLASAQICVIQHISRLQHSAWAFQCIRARYRMALMRQAVYLVSVCVCQALILAIHLDKSVPKSVKSVLVTTQWHYKFKGVQCFSFAVCVHTTARSADSASFSGFRILVNILFALNAV